MKVYDMSENIPKERFLWEFSRAMAHIGPGGAYVKTPCPNCKGEMCTLSVDIGLGSIAVLHRCGTVATWYAATIFDSVNVHERPIKQLKGGK